MPLWAAFLEEEAAHLLDALDLGLIVTDRRLGTIEFANAGAQEIVAAFSGQGATELPGTVAAALGPVEQLPDSGFSRAVKVTAPTGRGFYVRARVLPDSTGVLIAITRSVIREHELREFLNARFGLSAQHSKIIGHLRRGLSNQEIAREMNLSPVTVKHYVSEILTALGARRRTEIVAIIENLDVS